MTGGLAGNAALTVITHVNGLKLYSSVGTPMEQCWINVVDGGPTLHYLLGNLHASLETRMNWSSEMI